MKSIVVAAPCGITSGIMTNAATPLEKARPSGDEIIAAQVPLID